MMFGRIRQIWSGCSFSRLSFFILAFPVILICSPPLFAEGSAQLGPWQALKDFSKGRTLRTVEASSLYVDILEAGETIHVSLCGANDSDSYTVQIYNPDGQQVFDSGLIQEGPGCHADSGTTPPAVVQFETEQTGAHRLVMENIDDLQFRYFDISVAKDIHSQPDGQTLNGRLWTYSWNMNSDSFSEARSTDADFYALMPGGRQNSHYIWKLDLNNFAGWEYDIVANDIGVDAPGSGYSTPREGHSVQYRFPLYLNVPAIANQRPELAPVLTSVRFIDGEGEDFTLSQTIEGNITESGFFEFQSDVEGTYSLDIDLNSNGIYGDAGDTTLLGRATTGLNRIEWDGRDSSGNYALTGTYTAMISVRLGEYHFIAEDVESSGGGSHASDPVEGAGLTIFAVDPEGQESDTRVYWDDKTLLGSGTSNTPNGALSSTPEGRHAWGDFSGEGIGNNGYIDTYVYGLQTRATTQVRIADELQILTGSQATLTVSEGVESGQALTVHLQDADLNADPAIRESAIVTAENNTHGESEQVLLRETTSDSGQFEGNLPTRLSGTGQNNDGVLSVLPSQVITVSYYDQLDENGDADWVRAQGSMAAATDGDSDGDGIPDSSDTDDDNDGITDLLEGGADSDGDGLPDSRDIDSDNDLIPDLIETSGDFDGDGVPNYLDLDSDNDGIPDSVEALPIISTTESNTESGLTGDAQNPVFTNVPDTDGDGLPDFRDLDSDNDSLSDWRESRGEIEPISGALYPIVDINRDGADDTLLLDRQSVADTDSDRIFDHRDLDSDQDSIPGLVESGGSDADNDGRLDVVIDTNLDGMHDAAQSIAPAAPDSDVDGLPNYLDLDSDDNGTTDLAETGAIDGASDGIVDVLLDSDLNGLANTVDAGMTGGADTDVDGIDDRVDASQILETDLDGDDIADEFDADANGDGWVDSQPVIGAYGVSESAEENEPVLYTGLGGGCSIASAPTEGVDPVLPGVVFVALAGILLRRRYSSNKAILVAIVLTGSSLLYPASGLYAETSWFGQNLQPHWYLGFGAGASRLKPDERSVDYELVDRTDRAMNVVFGVDVFSHLSGELQFNHLGKARLEPDAELTYRVYGASALLYSPAFVGGQGPRTGLRAFGRIGTGKLDNSSNVSYEQKNGYHLLSGFGLEYGTAGPLALRLEYTRYDRDALYTGVAVIYRSGMEHSKKENAESTYSQIITLPPLPEMQTIESEIPEKSFAGVTEGVTFDTGHDNLTATAELTLTELADRLLPYPSLKLLVMAHTDSRGRADFNLKLSQARADAVVEFLVSRGIDRQNLLPRAYGESLPIASNQTVEGRAANRRVEFQALE